MFSHPDDPMSVIEARKVQRSYMAKWIKEARHSSPSREHDMGNDATAAAAQRKSGRAGHGAGDLVKLPSDNKARSSLRANKMIITA